MLASCRRWWLRSIFGPEMYQNDIKWDRWLVFFYRTLKGE